MPESTGPAPEVNLTPQPTTSPQDAPCSDCPAPWRVVQKRLAGSPTSIHQIVSADGALVCVINATTRLGLKVPADAAAVAKRIVDAVNAVAALAAGVSSDWPTAEAQARAEKRLEELAAQARVQPSAEGKSS